MHARRYYRAPMLLPLFFAWEVMLVTVASDLLPERVLVVFVVGALGMICVILAILFAPTSPVSE